MDSHQNKDRITRQSEHKGRQTNNSSLVSKQMTLYSNKNISKKKKNAPTPVKSIQIKNETSTKTSPIQEIVLSSIKSRLAASQKKQKSITSENKSKSEASYDSNKLLPPLPVAKTFLEFMNNTTPHDKWPEGKKNCSDDESGSHEIARKVKMIFTPSPNANEKSISSHSDETNISNDIEEEKTVEESECTYSTYITKKMSPKIKFNVLEEQKNEYGMKEGHYNLLHAYIRGELFKRIKILSESHLDLNGYIMKQCLEKCGYDASIHGTQFINECRMEVRKTMNSRRGYVKRKITHLMEGKFFLYNFKLKHKLISKFYENYY